MTSEEGTVLARSQAGYRLVSKVLSGKGAIIYGVRILQIGRNAAQRKDIECICPLSVRVLYGISKSHLLDIIFF